MLKVGLTGNIASGKSSVAGVWRSLGATVVDADELARRAVEPGTPALARIAERWGADVLDRDGRLDRARLREIVFADPEQRRHLEQIVHPEVQRLRQEEYGRAASGGAPLVVADVPLLFEAGLEPEFDRIVVVDAPEQERHRRLVQDRGLDADTATRMIRAQMPAASKRSRADFVIENSGSLPELQRRAVAVWRELAAGAGER